MSERIVFNQSKFRELLLYVAESMQSDASFGATILNKVLYFSDFGAFRDLGAAITGARYFKLENGPAPRALVPVVDELVAEGRAVVQERKRGGFTQRRLVAVDQANLDDFSGREIALVDSVIAELRDRDAVDVSRLSHTRSVGWVAAEMREDIPYPTAFLAPPAPPTPAQERRAKELVAAHDRGSL